MREKITKGVSINKDDILKYVLYIIGGLVLGGSKIAGVFSPFSIAFCMAAPLEYSISALIGSLIGIISTPSSSSIIYLCAIIFAMMIKILFKSKHAVFNSIIAGTTLFIVNLFKIIIAPIGLLSIIMIVAECMLTISTTFLFISGINGIKKPTKNASEIVGLSILAIAIILAISGIDIFGFNLGIIISAFLILESALLYGSAGGSMIGLLCTVALCLYTKNYALVGAVLAVSGFISGIFKPLGKLAQSSMFIGVFLLSSVFVGGLNIKWFIGVLIATCISFIIPIKLFNKVIINKKVDQKEEIKLTDDLSLKLEFTARTLLDLQENVEQCAVKLDKLNITDLNRINKHTIEKVCRDCGLKQFCWVTNYQTTNRAINSVNNIIKDKGSIDLDDFPAFFKQKCCKLNELIDEVNIGYREYLSQEQNARRINQAREVATQQFSSMSSLLMDMSDEINEYSKRDEQIEYIVIDIFNENGLNPKRVSCLLDKYDRMTIDVYITQRARKKILIDITQNMVDRLDRDLELPSIMQANGEYKISFFEEAVYKPDFYASNYSKEGENCCGDSYDYFIDSKGFAHIILSDGMGSGKLAAIDSIMTCGTLKKLLQNGFGFDSAFKLINASFSIKSNEESLATIDVCTIDLYTGDTNFIKAGAATSFVKRKNDIISFCATTLPIGIIQGIPYDTDTTKLSKGDVIVMVSDGALISGENWIAQELKLHFKKSAKEISKIILESAKQRVVDGHQDDITVLVLKLK